MKKLIFITVILLLLTTCILIKPNWSSPNSITGSNNTVIQTTTTGQELMDLKEARVSFSFLANPSARKVVSFTQLT